LAAGLLVQVLEPGRSPMLQSIRRALPIPQVPVHAVVCGTSVLAFGWLLANDSIKPIAVYLLQIYLAF
jgi:hypothetical protein